MKATEIRELSIEEIGAKLEEVRDQYARMRLNHAVSGIENPATIKFNRRDIARLLTIMNEKTLQELNK